MSELSFTQGTGAHQTEQFERHQRANGPSQVQLNNGYPSLKPDQLDQLVLEQLKTHTQEIVDRAVIAQTSSKSSPDKHDAGGAHENGSSSSTGSPLLGEVGK